MKDRTKLSDARDVLFVALIDKALPPWARLYGWLERQRKAAIERTYVRLDSMESWMPPEHPAAGAMGDRIVARARSEAMAAPEGAALEEHPFKHDAVVAEAIARAPELWNAECERLNDPLRVMRGEEDEIAGVGVQKLAALHVLGHLEREKERRERPEDRDVCSCRPGDDAPAIDCVIHGAPL